MNQEAKHELEQLLHEAMENIVIEAPEGYEPISVDTYKDRLQSLRKHYQPGLDSHLISYNLDIQNEDIKSKLVDFINVQFKDFINEEFNMIQPASYGIGKGGRPAGKDVDILLTKLLQIAIASGERRAIAAFDTSIRETTGSFQKIILLQGPGTHPKDSGKITEIKVCEGVRLVFLPSNPEKLPPYLFDGGFSSLFFQSNLGIFMRKAIIVIDCEVSPLFFRPKLCVTVNHDGSKTLSRAENTDPFQIKIKSTESPEFNVDQFCQAISLICNFACVPILEWGYIDPDEIFSVGGDSGLIPTAQCVLPNNPLGLGRISETQIPEIKHRYEILTNLDSETREKLQVALDRWIKSKAGNNPADKIIDLGIALESLYLPKSSIEQLSFQFRLRASWHLGNCKGNREKLMDEFKAIYDLRSKAVHNGAVPEKIKVRKGEERIATSEFIPRAQDLCRQSIMKILEDGKFPDWNDLILG